MFVLLLWTCDEQKSPLTSLSDHFSSDALMVMSMAVWQDALFVHKGSLVFLMKMEENCFLTFIRDISPFSSTDRCIAQSGLRKGCWRK